MALLENVTGFLTRLFGSRNERLIKSVLPIVDQINALEPKYESYTDAQLREETDKFKERLQKGETLDDILPEAFALVREGGKRFLGMRHFDVQLIGGYFLHKGNVVEMVTGEGKTLVATLPAYLNALVGKGVHVVTVNDYLAKRDRDWNAPLYEALGLTVGVIQSDMDPQERIKEYSCDITYGTNNEFGFDYLRDNMKMNKEDQCQRHRYYAIIDEVDSVLIDEARTPLIISGGGEGSTDVYYKANRIAKQLKKGVDYTIKEKEKAILMTEEGIEKAEQLAQSIAGVKGSLYSGQNGLIWPHALENALSAKEFYKKDIDYVVQDGKVIIVDEFTGRLMHGRTWSDGLHQAVEAKEGLKVQEESQTLATITFQNFFRLYEKLAGMTGTAITEAAEFDKIYKLDVVVIPTNRPLRRINYPDRIYGTINDKFKAIEEEIVTIHATGRPILVGTISIENSEKLSNQIRRRGIPHEVLNAKHHEREAMIVAKAGQLGMVTIATNMAGRGTDIVLGKFTKEELLEHWKEWGFAPKKVKVDDPDLYDVLERHWKKNGWLQKLESCGMLQTFEHNGKSYTGIPLCTSVKELGGLHIIGTERHEARRIDNQLRGRCGRQGDPGSSRFFLSLEDDLMRIFMGDWAKGFMQKMGLSEGQDLSSPMVSRAIERAQTKVEAHNFEIRKHLLDYDKVMDEQRTLVYSERQAILEGENLKPKILGWIKEDIEKAVDTFIGDKVEEESRDYEAFQFLILNKYDVLVDLKKYESRPGEFKTPKEMAAYIIDKVEQIRSREIQEQIETYVKREMGRDVEVDDRRKRKFMNWANSKLKMDIQPEEMERLEEGEDVIEFFCQRAEELELGSLTDEEKDQIRQMVERKFEDPSNLEKAINDIRDWLYKKYNAPLLLADFYARQPVYSNVAEGVFEEVKKAYEEREKEMGEEDMRRLEGFLLLQKIDEKWKDHLRAMDELKSSIGMRGYGQEDPKIAYKKEGYKMFEEMYQSLKNEVTELILKLVLVKEEEVRDVWNIDESEAIHEEFAGALAAHKEAEQQAMEAGREGPVRTIRNQSKRKVGRNDPCPCGSGRKYKKCCGE
ncbi:MAG: preprotein translocase subunit SecA [Planctomycetota bacterium]|nr:MAG: preprotein translocase subunit SecA [Planctomycetota bacterium]